MARVAFAISRKQTGVIMSHWLQGKGCSSTGMKMWKSLTPTQCFKVRFAFSKRSAPAKVSTSKCFAGDTLCEPWRIMDLTLFFHPRWKIGWKFFAGEANHRFYLIMPFRF